jgi:hypothetical protein
LPARELSGLIWPWARWYAAIFAESSAFCRVNDRASVIEAAGRRATEKVRRRAGPGGLAFVLAFPGVWVLRMRHGFLLAGVSGLS